MKKIIIILLFLFIIIFLYIGPFKNLVGFFSSKDAAKAVDSIERISEAVETYIIDWGFSPNVNNIKALSSIILKAYDKNIPIKDPWGNTIIYKNIGKDDYKITIIGKDKKPFTVDDLTYEKGKFKYDPKNNRYKSIINKDM